MATSSITHNFVVSDPKRFVEAFEASEKEPKTELPTFRELHDPQEIAALLAKRTK